MRPKEQIAAVSKRLRDAAKLQEPHALSVVQLLVLLAEEAKERLITAEGDELLREQGAARELRRVVRELTVEPPSIGSKE